MVRAETRDRREDPAEVEFRTTAVVEHLHREHGVEGTGRRKPEPLFDPDSTDRLCKVPHGRAGPIKAGEVARSEECGPSSVVVLAERRDKVVELITRARGP